MKKIEAMFYRMALALLFAAIVGVLIAGAVPAQSGREKKAKREKFGQSLKRLKWDSKKGAAVEDAKRKNAPAVAPSDGDVIKLETLFVALEVTVTDPSRSRFVTGLGKDDFVVIEDGRPQQVATLTPGDDQSLPRSIILILDYSGSQSPYIEASIAAAKNLVLQLASADEMTIITDSVELLIDFTSDKAMLIKTLDSFKQRALAKTRRGRSSRRTRGDSLQFTALFAALRELVKSEGVQPIIIFQTDGDEAVTFRDQPTASDYLWNRPRRNYGLADIYKAVERSRATIYTVVPGNSLIGLPPEELYDRGRQMLYRVERTRFETEQEYLKYLEGDPISEAYVKLQTDRFARSQEAAARVADMTGGWTAFIKKPDEASSIYARILSNINHRYVIGYYPTNTERDGRLRRVRIEVKGHPEYLVHGRNSYYAQ
ncbi:MAG: VWA domain-containing protein [Blastocatellia bacterium]|nr:VWA domain-containing protein [Blastocatellia bacterium]